MMFRKGGFDYVYEGLNQTSAEGDNPELCIDLLQSNNLSSDTFLLSPDEKTITQFREGVAINVLHRVKPL